jgi:hypothetical protein
VHGRVATSELGGGRPVGGDAPSVEQPRGREQERTGAHGRRAPGARGGARDPLDGRGIACRVVRAGAAGHDQRVGPCGRVGEVAMRHDLEPARSAQRSAIAAEDQNLIAAVNHCGGFVQRSTVVSRSASVSGGLAQRSARVPSGLAQSPTGTRGGRDQHIGAREHLERPGDIEALHTGEREDRDLARSLVLGHSSIMPQHRPVRKDISPTISAMAVKSAIKLGLPLAGLHLCSQLRNKSIGLLDSAGVRRGRHARGDRLACACAIGNRLDNAVGVCAVVRYCDDP